MRVYSDMNFGLLIILLAITLLSLISGFQMAELKYSPFYYSKFVFSIFFLILALILMGVAIMSPFSVYMVGHFSIILGILKIMEEIFYFIFRKQLLLEFGYSIIISEFVSALLLIIAGFLLLSLRRD